MATTLGRTLNAEKLRELARAGADVTLKRLRAEIIAIERTFPELALPKRRRAARKAVKQATNRTRRMSAGSRNECSATGRNAERPRQRSSSETSQRQGSK